MSNFLHLLDNPQMNFERYFEVMRDFRKGGLNPEMYQEFISLVKQLPVIVQRTPQDFILFDKFNLKDISEKEFSDIQHEVMKRGIDASKKCWHPEASSITCKTDAGGNIIVSAAHSIQENGLLNKIAEDGHVMGYYLVKGDFKVTKIRIKPASIFWGFCNTHDAIFYPIETVAYHGTEQQHFLFAYRGFVVSYHKKIEASSWMNFDEQSDNDIKANKSIFDTAILSLNHSIIETEVFELPAFYPIAVSTSFYLDFDFEGNEIKHSDDRMEIIFVTLHPINNKTYFFLSYFKQDKHLYGDLGNQLRQKNNLKSDITMLIAAHTENVYFNPIYYTTFIQQFEEILKTLMFQTQFDHAIIDENNEPRAIFSYTPSNYLDNKYGISFFGY